LGVGPGASKGKQSSFMKKVNQPLIKNQIKEDLLDAFMQLIDQERLIEQSKISLISHSDFNVFDAFKIFDQMGRGCLTLSELYNGLVNQLGLVPSEDEIELFFQRYDKDRDGILRFAEFSNAFVPIDHNYKDVLNSRGSNHRSATFHATNPEGVFVPSTLLDFKELWRTHFRVELLAENLRQSLE